MVSTTALTEIAALVGDPARANILTALLDGRALTAGELARAAFVTRQTASGHLSKLTAAGLLAVEQQGRHRYHRLAAPSVARMLEAIMAVAAVDPMVDRTRRSIVVGPRDLALRAARTCYDHLAGRLAVAIADALVTRGQIELSLDGGIVTAEGAAFFRSLGLNLPDAKGNSPKQKARVFCRPCMDWSERRPHVAGTVGAALCACCFSLGWIKRMEGTRAVTVTAKGQLAIKRSFGLDS